MASPIDTRYTGRLMASNPARCVLTDDRCTRVVCAVRGQCARALTRRGHWSS